MKPSLFNTDMVRAILNDRKTVTRRVVRPQPREIYHGGTLYEDDGDLIALVEAMNGRFEQAVSPYRPGDILYVRETWQFIPCIDCGAMENCNMQPITYEDRDMEGEGCFVYRADYPEPDRILWHPSIHMPREAARIFLRVTDVRVERLQDIGDCTKEGIMPGKHETAHMNDYDERCDFKYLWNSTIKPADRALYGWDANPWVWVIEFERISREEALLRRACKKSR